VPGYFKCECGCTQSFASEDCNGGITIKEAEKIGWRKIGGSWVCPICCGNTAALEAMFDKALDAAINHVDDEHGEKCESCGCDIEAAEERAAKSLEEYGWYAHLVYNDPKYPYNCNIHTHGFQANFSHPDLQICMPLDPQVVQGVLIGALKQIEEGAKFEVGQIAYNFIKEGYPVTFARSEECGREVLRIILPDQNKNLDPDTMAPEFSEQWLNTL